MPKKRKGGRRPALTAEAKEAVLGAVRDSQTYEVAARRAGVAERTLYGWIEKGEAGAAPVYAQFVQELARAKAEAEESIITGIKAAGRHDWRALAWIAERRYPDRWGRSESAKVEHSGAITIVFKEVGRGKEAAASAGDGAAEGGRGRTDRDVLRVPHGQP